VPVGSRTLVVDAVAYHLSGHTASGLPVGIGVVAVDPSVIPLGTRLFVPGYGPAVAADVGSAIKGNIIDLWMPSTPAAQAWGRRTVTITVYG
jgi:3D (Asp-Asp-Asp) domain-containing protein